MNDDDEAEAEDEKETKREGDSETARERVIQCLSSLYLFSPSLQFLHNRRLPSRPKAEGNEGRKEGVASGKLF